MLIIGNGTLSTRRIPRQRFVIGAAADCDVTLAHPSVSPYHAVVEAGSSLAVRYIGATEAAPDIPDGGSSLPMDSSLAMRRIGPADAAPTVPDAGHADASRTLRVGDSFRVGTLSCLIMDRAPVEPSDGELDKQLDGTQLDSNGELGNQRGGNQPDGALASEICVPDPTVAGAPAVVRTIAASMLSLLILGETGVGKDILARTLHELSNRTGPYVRINCAALAEALLESEMFGHERGAFTGATVQKTGLLEFAHGGTVFLDEIGELSPTLQAKLLRAVESGEVTRVGSVRPTPIDVRFIAATHRDLAADVVSGRFRADLFYRLDGVSLTVPPLRDRREQIIPLALRFIATAHAAGPRPALATPGFLARLEAHDWPGNVRELKATVERAVLIAAGTELTASHLIFSRRLAASSRPPATAGPSGDLRADALCDRTRVIEALNACAGNQTRAAKKLGISRATLTNKLTLYRLPRPQS